MFYNVLSQVTRSYIFVVLSVIYRLPVITYHSHDSYDLCKSFWYTFLFSVCDQRILRSIWIDLCHKETTSLFLSFGYIFCSVNCHYFTVTIKNLTLLQFSYLQLSKQSHSKRNGTQLGLLKKSFWYTFLCLKLSPRHYVTRIHLKSQFYVILQQSM